MINSKSWFDVCHKNDLIQNAGVCALMTNQEQIVILDDDQETVRMKSIIEGVVEQLENSSIPVQTIRITPRRWLSSF